MNVSLSKELEELVRRKVRSGRYCTASEVVREALRLFEVSEAAGHSEGAAGHFSDGTQSEAFEVAADPQSRDAKPDNNNQLLTWYLDNNCQLS